MCGLSGYARMGRVTAEPDHAILHAMAETLKHRGPDGIAVKIAGQVGLGFTRLSIVDPTGGDQPIVSPDGSVALIANGEVYNHKELAANLPSGTRFRSKSDCEVLVHLYQRYGIDFLRDVRGIYAVVIWDTAKKQLIFARDRFGIKPLYFHRNQNRIVFGSEIKALFVDPECPRKLDWAACLADQVCTSAPTFEASAPITFFEGIEAAPAATVVSFDMETGQRGDYPYWKLPRFAGQSGATRDELVCAYRGALISSVEESCMSDAEIGLMLSGGIDSAAVGALAKTPQPLQTFTALNGGTLANGDGEHAHRVAALLGLPNHQVLLSTDQVPEPDEWRALLWQVESPLCGPEQFYKFEVHRFARATRPDLKVMLLGQASDEFNGGYSTVIGEGNWPDFVARLRYMARESALQRAPKLAPWWRHQFPLLREEALADGRRRGLPADGLGGAADADLYQAYIEWKYRDIQQYNCWHEDRTAAGNGIEARVPFLDHRVVEAAAAVPPELYEELLWDKEILRAALDGILPPEVLKRPKVPFFYGVGEYHVNLTFTEMLARNNEELIDQALSGPGAGQYLDADGIRATLGWLRTEPARGHISFLLRTVNLGLLEQLLASHPAPAARERVRLATELPVKDWKAERETITARVTGPRRLQPDAVPDWAPDVLLLAPVPSDGTAYIVVDGAIEYVVSAQEDPAWSSVVERIDAVRTIGELLGPLGTVDSPVAAQLMEAVAAGLIIVREPGSGTP